MSTPEAATWLACLTPPGAGAIATLALRGPQAWPIARSLFQPLSPTAPPLPDQPQPGRFRLGRLGIDVADEVVLAVKRSAPSPWLEIHCHGGVEVVRLLTEAMVSKGAQSCSWRELEEHSGTDSLTTAATAALCEALTVRTAAILLDQFHGALGHAIASILGLLGAISPAIAAGVARPLFGGPAPDGTRESGHWVRNVGRAACERSRLSTKHCVADAGHDACRHYDDRGRWLAAELCDTAGARGGRVAGSGRHARARDARRGRPLAADASDGRRVRSRRPITACSSSTRPIFPPPGTGGRFRTRFRCRHRPARGCPSYARRWPGGWCQSLRHPGRRSPSPLNRSMPSTMPCAPVVRGMPRKRRNICVGRDLSDCLT